MKKPETMQEIMQQAIDMLTASLRCDSPEEQAKVLKQVRYDLFQYSA